VSAPAVTWLAGRAPAPPSGLQAHLDRALASGEDTNVAAALAEAARAQLGAALALGDARAAAFELLVADALLTYVFEAAAEIGVDTVAAAAEAFGPGFLAPLLADHT
jgi:hypothetical protein